MQVHQVARVRGEAEEAPEENSVETRPSLRLPVSPGHGYWDGNSIPTQPGEARRPLPPAAPRPRGLLGRCYLSAVNGQVRTHPCLSPPQLCPFSFSLSSVFLLNVSVCRDSHSPDRKTQGIKLPE